jgi:hypothetical protein
MNLVEKVREWMTRRKSSGSGGSGGGLFGKPGTTQRPGRSSGGPGEGPMKGGSEGPGGAG